MISTLKNLVIFLAFIGGLGWGVVQLHSKFGAFRQERADAWQADQDSRERKRAEGRAEAVAANQAIYAEGERQNKVVGTGWARSSTYVKGFGPVGGYTQIPVTQEMVDNRNRRKEAEKDMTPDQKAEARRHEGFRQYKPYGNDDQWVENLPPGRYATKEQLEKSKLTLMPTK